MRTTKGLLLLGVLAFASACNTAPSEAGTKVTDLIGREVTVNVGSYRRVVCIGAGALRMYSYIGEVGKLAGVEDIDNETLAQRPKMFDGAPRPYVLAFGEEFAKLPSCGVGGPNAQEIETEKILSCNPDLIVSLYEDVDKANALQEAVGVPVITLASGVDGVFAENTKTSLKLLGKVLGKDEKANTLCNFIDAEREAIFNRTKDIPESEKPKTYICGLGNWGTTNHLMTAGVFAPFTVAHIENVDTGIQGKAISPIDKEKFVALGSSMDKMIIDAAAVKNIKPLYQEDPTMFDTCKAWQNGEVYLQMPYNAYYTNMETALINTWYCASAVYPSRFGDFNLENKANEITQAFLGAQLYNKIKSKPQAFGGYQKINTEAFFA